MVFSKRAEAAEAEAESHQPTRQEPFLPPNLASVLESGYMSHHQHISSSSANGSGSDAKHSAGAGAPTQQNGSNGSPSCQKEDEHLLAPEDPQTALVSTLATMKKKKRRKSSKERVSHKDGGEPRSGGSKEHQHQRHMWSVDETEALIAGCQKHGVGNWKAILNDTDLRPRFSADRNPGDLKDRFRTKFPQAYAELYPNAKTHIPSRTLSEGSSKSHFEKGQSKERRSFSPAEDAVLKQGFALHGSSWTIIARDPVFGGRRKPTDLRDRFRNAWPQEYADAGYSARRKAGDTAGSTTSKGSAKSRERTLSHGSSRASHSHHEHAVPLPMANAESGIDDDLQGIFVRGLDGKPTLARSVSSTSASASSSSNTTFGPSESEVESGSEGWAAGGGVDFAWLRDTAAYGMSSPQEGFLGTQQIGAASQFSLHPDFVRSLSYGSAAQSRPRPTFNTQISSPGGLTGTANGNVTATPGVGLGFDGIVDSRGGSLEDPKNRLAEWHPEQLAELTLIQGQHSNYGVTSAVSSRSASHAGSRLGGFSPSFSSGTGPFSRSLPFDSAEQIQSLPPSDGPPQTFDPDAMDISSLGGAQLQQINELLQSYVQSTARGDEEEQQPPSSALYSVDEAGSGYASDSDAFSADGWVSDQSGIGLVTNEGGASTQSSLQDGWSMAQTDAYASASYSSVGMNTFQPYNGAADFTVGHNPFAHNPFIREDAPLNEPASVSIRDDGELGIAPAHQEQLRWPLTTSPSTGPSHRFFDSSPSVQPSMENSTEAAPLQVALSSAPSRENLAGADTLELTSNWHEEGYEEDEEPDDEGEEEEYIEEEEDSDDLLPRSNTIRPAKRLSSEDDDHGRRAALLFHHQQQQQRMWDSRSGDYASDSSLVSTPEGSSYAPSMYDDTDVGGSGVTAAAIVEVGTGEVVYGGAGDTVRDDVNRIRTANAQERLYQDQRQEHVHPLDEINLQLDLAALLRGSSAADSETNGNIGSIGSRENQSQSKAH